MLDSLTDDEVARLWEAMNTAADEDICLNNDKVPAMAKLRLLPEAMDTLQVRLDQIFISFKYSAISVT